VDTALVIAIVVSFATLVTAHVALAMGLLTRTPRIRALLALLLPPLAPYYGAREKMWIRTTVWTLALVTYVAARVAAR